MQSHRILFIIKFAFILLFPRWARKSRIYWGSEDCEETKSLALGRFASNGGIPELRRRRIRRFAGISRRRRRAVGVHRRCGSPRRLRRDLRRSRRFVLNPLPRPPVRLRRSRWRPSRNPRLFRGLRRFVRRAVCWARRGLFFGWKVCSSSLSYAFAIVVGCRVDFHFFTTAKAKSHFCVIRESISILRWDFFALQV